MLKISSFDGAFQVLQVLFSQVKKTLQLRALISFKKGTTIFLFMSFH